MSMPGETPASGRAAVPGLVSPAPFIDRLPALYADSDFTGRFVAAFDDVLAPVFAVLDCLEAYLDPSLAPADFLAMLGRWTAADTDASQPAPAASPDSPDSPASPDSPDSADARRLVAEATACHAARGTIRGLAQRLTRVFGIDADISDNGGVSWSATPSGPLPGSDELFLRVRLRAPSGDAVLMQHIKTLIEDDRPAHVPVWIDVVDTSEVVDQDRQEPSP